MAITQNVHCILNYVQSSFPYKSDFYVDAILCNDCFCGYKRARFNWWL